MHNQTAFYGRQLLLGGAKRNAVLHLWEAQRYGADSFGDSDYVSIYGMRPGEWYAKGVRLLGRTAVECTRDALAQAIGKDIAALAARAPAAAAPLIIDPFVGSANTLYWIARELGAARGVGFELDPLVFQLTHQNIAALALPLDIVQADYVSGLASIAPATNQLVIGFIAPPWGQALSAQSGLDLRRTSPPVSDVVQAFGAWFPYGPLLCAIQIYETVQPDSLSELAQRFDWSQMKIYALNAPGTNHGVLLGTRGWKP